jgi:DNA replication protein DnaC
MGEYDLPVAERQRLYAEAHEREVAEAKKAELQNRREKARKLARELGPAYASCTLDSFELHKDPDIAKRQKRVLEGVRGYAENLAEETRNGCSVVLYGPSGTGKDHLITALCWLAILRHGLSVRWIRGSRLFLEMRDAMGRDSERELMAQYAVAPILFVSDPLPPMGALTPHQAMMLCDIVDERNRQKRPIWVTLNVADRSDADQRLGAPIVDRLVERALTAHMDWPSYRSAL